LPVNTTYTKEQYANCFQQGAVQGFDYFFKTYYTALCFFATRITNNSEAAKDIASNAFIKTWAKHAQLNTAAGIKAYLYQVVRNDCYKWLQQQQKTIALQKELSVHSPAASQSHLHHIIAAEVLSELHAHMQHLPEACKKIFTKLYVEGKTVAETAAELNLHVSTVKTQKERGMVFLKKRLLFDL